MATKIQKPSYITLQSALQFHGINFQYDSSIYVAGYKTEEITVDGRHLIFRVLKKQVRENFDGIIMNKGYPIASKERAILDTLYLYKTYFFDNIASVDMEELQKLSKIYGSKRLEKTVQDLLHKYAKNEYYS